MTQPRGTATAPAPLSACDAPLASRYDVALLDLDGVVYVGPDPVPDAPENLRKAAAAGMRIGYITNNASRPASVVAEHLASFGLDVITEDVVTSAQAAAKLIAAEFPAGSPVLVIGGEGLYAALAEYGLTAVKSSDADPVAVVQGFHPDVNWVMLADGAHAINQGARWYATNLDLTIPTAGGTAPGNGTLVQAVRAAVEVDPTVAGKPEPPLLETSIERLAAKQPLMIGDRLDSDIAGANAVGIASLWVATGVNDARDLVVAPADQRPTYIAAGLGALAEPQPGVEVDGRKHTCGGWTAEVVDGTVEMTGDGKPYDGLRAILSAAWQTLDEAAESGAGDSAAERAAGGAGAAGVAKRTVRSAKAGRKLAAKRAPRASTRPAPEAPEDKAPTGKPPAAEAVGKLAIEAALQKVGLEKR